MPPVLKKPIIFSGRVCTEPARELAAPARLEDGPNLGQERQAEEPGGGRPHGCEGRADVGFMVGGFRAVGGGLLEKKFEVNLTAVSCR